MTSLVISPAALEKLPNELLYRLLDLLDTETILFSFAYVCRRFRSIAQSHQAYRLNFKSISQRLFHRQCHQIKSDQIISLILSNDNRTPEQISSFLHYFSSTSFTHLHSLTLIDIDEADFHRLFHIVNSISSLSFSFSKKRLINTKTLPLIETIIAEKNLRHLSFSLAFDHIENLRWPPICSIQSLTLANRLSFRQFSQILSSSFLLKTIVLQDCFFDDQYHLKNLFENQISYRQLKSLTMDNCILDMNECELLFRFTPALEYLQIVSSKNLNDGSRWERFIEEHLIYLKKFDFALSGDIYFILGETIDLNEFIRSFRTSFWIERKKWFVICYYFTNLSNYGLYSLPICKTNVRFHPEKDKIFVTTYPQFYADRTITNQVKEMQLNLTNLTEHDEQNISINPYFDKLEKLSIMIADKWPVDSIIWLTKLINLQNLQDLSISIEFDVRSKSEKLKNISTLLAHAHNIRSLNIDTLLMDAETICSIVPKHVRHLQICVKTLDEMKIIIEQQQHLFSATFEVFRDMKSLSTDLLSWVMKTRPNSRYRIDQIFISFWFN